MKKMLLTMCIAGSSFLGYAQNFTPGNLVVIEQSSGNGSSVSLVEYSRSGGTSVSTLALPSNGTGDKVVLHSGTVGGTFEGILKLSSDFNYLTFGGYQADKGTASLYQSSTIPRVAVKVGIDKIASYNYITANATTGLGGKYLRFILTKNGADAWTGGNSSAILYLNNTTNPQGGVVVTNHTPSAISAGIFNDKLYYTANSSTPSRGLWRVNTVTPTLPKSTADVVSGATGVNDGITLIANPGGTGSACTDFVFFDTGGDSEPDLLYIGTDKVSPTQATDGEVAIYKYAYNTSTQQWDAKGQVDISGVVLAANRRINGITGYKNAAGKYVLFATTFGDILTVTDNAATWDAPMTGTVTSIASPSSGNSFRGIAFTPGSTPTVLLPVELKSFTGKAEGEAIRLNWSTASEKNNSHFEVLRSASGAPSEVIGREEGNGNSNAVSNYSFKDANPYAGTNYYQLKQVDKDGQSSKSEVIAVKSNVKATALSVSNGSGEEVLVHVNAANSASGSVTVSDILGNKLAEVKVSLEKGYNKVVVNTPGITPGVYVVTLNGTDKKLTAKFVR